MFLLGCESIAQKTMYLSSTVVLVLLGRKMKNWAHRRQAKMDPQCSKIYVIKS